MTTQTDESSPLMDSIAALPLEPTQNLDHLPTDKGLPIIGRTYDFIHHPEIWVEEQKKKLGPVFQTSMFFRKVVSMCDADAADLLLMDKEQNFSSRLGWARVGFLFNGGILLRDFHSHRIHRRPLQAAFKSATMNAYGEQLNAMIKHDVEQWPLDKTFKFQPAVKSLLLDNAAALFLGAELGEESKKLNQAFVDLLDGVLSVIRKSIPGLAYHRSIKGRAYIANWLDERFEERLNSDKNDFFTSLCQASQDPEHAMSKKEVIEHTLLLLFAAHDTTTSTLSNIMSILCQYPDWQQRLREECQAFEEPALSFGNIGQLEQCDRVLKETLRLAPPVFSIPRRAIRDFDYKGHRIPANTAIMLQVYSIHHDERYWSNPYQFDPERWSPERKEFKNHPYSYVPFGAGAHKCIGFRFAEMQTKIFLYNFLRHYKIETAPGRDTSIKQVPIPLPKDQLPARISRI